MLLAFFGGNPPIAAPVGAAGTGGVVMVQSNPLYQGAGISGNNPLHQ
ncbi:hypothetical protein [Pseudanabaena sp. UWO311]|nr:hypothetical protein [Pseudanabaena sp. UWO311]